MRFLHIHIVVPNWKTQKESLLCVVFSAEVARGGTLSQISTMWRVDSRWVNKDLFISLTSGSDADHASWLGSFQSHFYPFCFNLVWKWFSLLIGGEVNTPKDFPMIRWWWWWCCHICAVCRFRLLSCAHCICSINQSDFLFQKIPGNMAISGSLRRGLARSCSLSMLRSRLPVLTWLPAYSLTWLKMDMLAGLTVGLTAIPQALAYAEVAGLPVQVITTPLHL